MRYYIIKHFTCWSFACPEAEAYSPDIDRLVDHRGAVFARSNADFKTELYVGRVDGDCKAMLSKFIEGIEAGHPDSGDWLYISREYDQTLEWGETHLDIPGLGVLVEPIDSPEEIAQIESNWPKKA